MTNRNQIAHVNPNMSTIIWFDRLNVATKRNKVDENAKSNSVLSSRNFLKYENRDQKYKEKNIQCQW